jgi:hypothetical protein
MDHGETLGRSGLFDKKRTTNPLGESLRQEEFGAECRHDQRHVVAQVLGSTASIYIASGRWPQGAGASRRSYLGATGRARLDSLEIERGRRVHQSYDGDLLERTPLGRSHLLGQSHAAASDTHEQLGAEADFLERTQRKILDHQEGSSVPWKRREANLRRAGSKYLWTIQRARRLSPMASAK